VIHTMAPSKYALSSFLVSVRLLPVLLFNNIMVCDMKIK